MKKKVIVVGAGISGLMEAFMLHNAGLDVFLYAKGPNPRINLDKGKQHSSTRGGECGRFFTTREGEPYLDKNSLMYPDPKGAFQSHIDDGGWIAKYKDEFTDFDYSWLEKRYQACDDEKSIRVTERFYLDANKKALGLWQEMIVQFPELFVGTDLLNTGILRLYDNKVLFDWAVKIHQRENTLQRALTSSAVANDHPYFAEAVENGYVAGGVEAPGFSLNVHALTNNLIGYLQAKNVVFHWEEEISEIKISPLGLVEGLIKKDGVMIVSDNYALNPGAYSDEKLFKGTPAEGKIAGVAGRWLIMPAPKDFKRPTKIHGDVRVENGKKFPIIDINLTHFIDVDGNGKFAVGGGYGYVGKMPFKKDNPAFEIMDRENERNVSLYLGPIYREAKKSGLIEKSDATCVRSFTYNDVPVMDNIPTISGGICRINAGTNTGTATISPFTAKKTVEEMSKYNN